MPIGETQFTTKEVAAATGVCVTRATRKYQAWEDRLQFILGACRALAPKMRECDLAEMVLAVLETGGKLAQLDRDRLRQRLRTLVIDSAG